MANGKRTQIWDVNCHSTVTGTEWVATFRYEQDAIDYVKAHSTLVELSMVCRHRYL